MMIEDIKQRAFKINSWVRQIRHHIHANPELSFQEFNTSSFIKSKLNELGVQYTDGYVKTGIVAVIECENPSKRNIALRADMDALPINETNEVTYKSTVTNVMHACGHDVHSASLLGVVNIVNQLKETLEGTFTFIFQPAEEKLPGGASLMIAEGVFLKHPADLILGQHVTPQISTGKVGFKSGMFMASTDEIYIDVKGQGGHAAMPHLCNNPILIASKLLIKLQEEFQSQKLLQNKIETPTVLAFGKIVGNGATNVIPDVVNIEGTFRTFNEEWRDKAHEKIQTICNEIAQAEKATINCNIVKGYPFLVNDEKVTTQSIKLAQEFLGAENVLELDCRMTAEDFAFYSQIMPSCFYRIGTGNFSKNANNNVHTSNFNIDEDALEVMVGLMTYIAVNMS